MARFVDNRIMSPETVFKLHLLISLVVAAIVILSATNVWVSQKVRDDPTDTKSVNTSQRLNIGMLVISAILFFPFIWWYGALAKNSWKNA